MDNTSHNAGRRAFGYGSGVHRLDVDARTWDPAALTEHVRAIFASPTYTPPALPVVAMEVMTLSRREDVDLKHIAALIGRDPVLVGRLLRVANSPAFRGTTPLRSLNQALARLGLSTMRDLVMADSLALKVFRTGGGYADSLEELRIHSLGTAHLARLVSQRTGIESENAFLAGMLHDIGFATILIAMGNVDRGRAPPPLEMLWPVAEQVHEQMGGIVSRLWRFPDELTTVIERHHHLLTGGRIQPAVAILHVAAQLLFENGVAFLPKLPDGTVLMDIDAPVQVDFERAVVALNLGTEAMARLRADAERLVATIV